MQKGVQVIFMVILSIMGAMTTAPARAADKPAIVLVAFGTSTQAFETYKHFEDKVKERFPGHEVLWAFTSKKIQKKLKEERQVELRDLPQVLQDLKARGIERVAVQSLHVVPGKEWDKKVVAAQKEVPGLKVALGKPLLSSEADQQRVLTALATAFPADLKGTAVVLVAHGSPQAQGEKAYLTLQKLLQARYKGKNVFLGAVDFEPSADKALAAVKQSAAKSVLFIPLMFVAGDHMENDIMGDKDSWKAILLAHKPYRIEAVDKGLGYNEGVTAVYLDHLAEAVKHVTP